jgi:hypothetical protein
MLGALVAVAATVGAANAIRSLPPRAPLVRTASRLTLAGALLATVVAIAVPAPWQGYALIALVTLGTATVLIRSDPADAINTLAGVALVGAGVAVVGVGVAALVEGDIVGGVVFVGGGVALAGVGVAMLVRGDILGGVALAGGGVALAGQGWPYW